MYFTTKGSKLRTNFIALESDLLTIFILFQSKLDDRIPNKFYCIISDAINLWQLHFLTVHKQIELKTNTST